RKITAPIVAVIKLPQKSGTTSRRSFSKRKPPTTAPTRPTARLYSRPPRPPKIFVASHPASNPTMIQAMTPMVLSPIEGATRHGNLYKWTRNASGAALVLSRSRQFNGQETATTLECTHSCCDSRGLHCRRFSQRGFAVRRAADVHPDGAAATRRFAIGLVGGNGLLSVD